MGEYAMLRLRLAEGLCFAAFADRFGVGGRAYFRDPIVRYTSAGLLDTDDTRVALSDAGIAVADAIAAEFLSIASEKSRASSPL
jgi:coproporphyrinogen III oxidase-like Fe-S oxidoreductase